MTTKERIALLESLLEPDPNGDPEAEGIVASLRLEEALRDPGYDQWVSDVTAPDPHRSATAVCRMCGQQCPASYIRGHICADCDRQAGELTNPRIQ